MTPRNFLDHLVDRVLGVPSAIVPRLPSLFEPPGGHVALSDGGEERQVLAPARQAPVTPPAMEPVAEPDPQTSAVRRTGNPAATQEAALHQAVGRDNEADQQVPETPAAPAGVATLVANEEAITRIAASIAPSGADPTDRSTPPSLHPAPPPRERGLIETNDLEAPAPPTLVASGPVVIRDADIESRTAPKGTNEQPAQRNGSPPDSDSRGALVPDRALSLEPRTATFAVSDVRLHPRRDTAAPDLPEQAPTPVVNVTIGRVEVRAVQPPPGKPRTDTTRKSKPLSLDDYLKTRGGSQ